MEECKNFSGHKYNICTGNTSMDKWKINRYREIWGLTPLYENESKPCKNNNGIVTVSSDLQNYDLQHMRSGDYHYIIPGPGTQLLKLYKDSEVPPCEDCFKLALKMNKWGPEECRKNIDHIVSDILPRALSWIEHNKPWTHKLLPNIIEEAAVKIKITSDINKSITIAEQELKNYKFKKTVPKKIAPPMRKSGCSCGKRK